MDNTVLLSDWNSLTVHQFQQAHALLTTYRAPEATDEEQLLANLDNLSKLLGILYNQSVDDIDELPVEEFNRRAKACQFLWSEAIPGKAEKYIVIQIGNEAIQYRINYRPFNMKQWQLKQLLEYLPNPVANLHNIMAVMVISKYPSHETDALLFLKAPIGPVYHAMCYFINLFIKAIDAVKPEVATALPKDTAGIVTSIIEAANAELAPYTHSSI